MNKPIVGNTDLLEHGTPRSVDESRPYISVVSPVYMADKILPVLCERLDNVLSEIAEDYEIILVCDGSPDRSWEVMMRLSEQFPRLVVVRLSRNFGQHYAITAGMDLSSGVWTVVMDCDLQDQPEEIPRLIDKAEQGADIVLARRCQRQHVWWKRTTSALFYRVFSLLSGFTFDSSVGCFRVMNRRVVDAFCSMRESYRMFSGLIEWLGFKTEFVNVQHAARFEGKSSYNLSRLLRMAMDGMISFSNRPLHISIGLGFCISLMASLYGLYLVVVYFVSPSIGVPGWLSTITATSFLGGLILINQGIIGIYLGRLYNQAKARPIYVIDRIIVGDKAKLSAKGTRNRG